MFAFMRACVCVSVSVLRVSLFFVASLALVSFRRSAEGSDASPV